MKESITGYLSTSWDVGKFENLLRVQYGSLDYAPWIGFDMDYWLRNDGIEFNVDTFNSWIKSESLKHSIVVSNVESSQERFSMNIKYTVSGKTYTTDRSYQ